MKLTDFREYTSAMTIYNDLTTQLNQATEALHEAGRLSAQEVETVTVDDQARSLLSGTVSEDTHKTRQIEVDIATQHLKVLKRAVEMQQYKVSEARGAASATICKEMAPTYTKIVKAYGEALTTLAGVIQSEQDFFDGLDRENILSRFERFSLFPEPNRETLDRISKLLTEIKRSGYKI